MLPWKLRSVRSVMSDVSELSDPAGSDMSVQGQYRASTRPVQVHRIGQGRGVWTHPTRLAWPGLDTYDTSGLADLTILTCLAMPDL